VEREPEFDLGSPLSSERDAIVEHAQECTFRLRNSQRKVFLRRLSFVAAVWPTRGEKSRTSGARGVAEPQTGPFLLPTAAGGKAIPGFDESATERSVAECKWHAESAGAG